MCGIAGQRGTQPSEGAARAALDAMQHRGPDQRGELRIDDVWLGHRRLSILDLSEAGRQPMANAEGTLHLTYNGEIYNFGELKRALEGRYVFRTRTDSEVLIHGYDAWGIEGLLDRIRGFFAFAIYDVPRRTLHVARDQLGKKPLYHSGGDGAPFAFASTLPALRALTGHSARIDRASVSEYLVGLAVPAPRSIFEGIAKLLPAHRIEVRAGEAPKTSRYWSPPAMQPERRSDDEWVDAIAATLEASVVRRLEADVPLGAFLSGGIDSSLVVGAMARASKKPVVTIAMGFSSGNDERAHAREVARVFGTDHREHVMNVDSAEALPRIVRAAGEPFGDHAALPTLYLAEAARREVTVVLTGDGGDEMFGGYHTATGARIAQPLHHLPFVADGTAARFVEGGPRRLRPARYVLAWASEGGAVPDALGVRGFRGMLDAIVEHGDEESLGFDRRFRAAFESGGSSWVDRVMAAELVTILPDLLLTKLDIATMAHSLEARSPFLDLEMLSLSRKIPGPQKVKLLRTKYLLRRLAERWLPRSITHRRKAGFSPPTADWMRQLARLARPILLSRAARDRGLVRIDTVRRLLDEHQSRRRDHGQRLYLLLVLEVWARMFVDGDLPTGATLEDIAQSEAGKLGAASLAAY